MSYKEKQMHRITIKNFGPLNEISLNINQTTIIIGEQANGDSSDFF